MKNRKHPPLLPPLAVASALIALAGYVYLQRGEWTPARPSRRVIPRAAAAPAAGTATSEEGSESSLIFQLNQEAVTLEELEEYRSAAEQLEEARQLAPDDEVLKHNLQSALLSWATSELLSGNLDEAERLLRRAQALGERADTLRVLGILLHQKRDFGAATVVLERALQLLPRDTSVLLALGDSYLQLEKRAQAFDVLQRAREIGVDAPGLGGLLQRLGREVDAEWDFVNLHTPHFTASFADSEEHSGVRVVLDGLEEAYTSVGQKLGYFPDTKTSVALYAEQDFHTATLTPDWAGGAFDGRIKVPLRGLSADDPGLARSLRHEYAHSVIAAIAGLACPVWLNEGVAVWAEEDVEGEREPWAQATVARLGMFRFADLDRAFVRLPGNTVEAAYAQSYLVVRALVDHYGNQGLRDFLDALHRNRDPEQALAELYGDSWTGLQEDVLARR